MSDLQLNRNFSSRSMSATAQNQRQRAAADSRSGQRHIRLFMGIMDYGWEWSNNNGSFKAPPRSPRHRFSPSNEYEGRLVGSSTRSENAGFTPPSLL